MSTMLAVDGSSCFMRAISVLPEEKRTGADLAYMVGRMLMKMVRRSRATHAAVALDSYPCWRYEFHPEYKGPREYSSFNPQELTQLIIPWLRQWHVPTMYKLGLEADDWLYTIASRVKPGATAYLCTRDSDLYGALLTDNVKLLWPEDGDYRVIDRAGACEQLGFPVEKLPQVRALAADQKDNIRGVLGTEKGWRCPISKKRAAELLAHFGDIFDIVDACEQLSPPAILKEKEVDYVREYKDQLVVMWQICSLREEGWDTINPRECDVRLFNIQIPEGS